MKFTDAEQKRVFRALSRQKLLCNNLADAYHNKGAWLTRDGLREEAAAFAQLECKMLELFESPKD